MASYEDKREEMDEEEEYVVTPSRAEFVWNDETGEMEDAVEENTSLPVSAEGQEDTSEKTENLDLSMLDLPEEKTETLPEPVDEQGFAAFAQQFQKYTGMDFKEAVQVFQGMQQFSATQKVDKERGELMQAWAVDAGELDNRLSVVRERFAKYDPDLQAKLNNPQGAQLIWAKIQQEEAAKKGKRVPELDRGTGKVNTKSTNSQYDYTQKQINAMSNEEYAKNANRIAAAFAAGRVKR